MMFTDWHILVRSVLLLLDMNNVCNSSQVSVSVLFRKQISRNKTPEQFANVLGLFLFPFYTKMKKFNKKRKAAVHCSPDGASLYEGREKSPKFYQQT